MTSYEERVAEFYRLEAWVSKRELDLKGLVDDIGELYEKLWECFKDGEGHDEVAQQAEPLLKKVEELINLCGSLILTEQEMRSLGVVIRD